MNSENCLRDAASGPLEEEVWQRVRNKLLRERSHKPSLKTMTRRFTVRKALELVVPTNSEHPGNCETEELTSEDEVESDPSDSSCSSDDSTERKSPRSPAEVNQGKGVVLEMTEGLQGNTVTFGNFFHLLWTGGGASKEKDGPSRYNSQEQTRASPTAAADKT
ncbi:unnamed protein product [Leuciscus chuanchicus]